MILIILTVYFPPKTSEDIIIIDPEETLEVERFFIGNTSFVIDETKESYIDVETNPAVFPVITTELNGLAEFEFDGDFTVKGICKKIARKKPRANPNACQGDCKCGIGFRCGTFTCDDGGTPNPRPNIPINIPVVVDKAVYDSDLSTISLVFENPINWHGINN